MTVSPQGSGPKASKVLLIDDNALTRSVLRAVLRDEGYADIREAKDADAGFKLAQHFAPDLICLDIQMPGKSGLVLLDELRVIAPAARVLMITASDDRATIDACLQGGAVGYIIKPFNAATVLKTVAEVLTRPH